MKYRKTLTGILGVLIAMVLAVSPAFAAEDQLIVLGKIAPDDRIDISGIVPSTEGESVQEQGFQIRNQSLDMCLNETGQTWKEWYAAVQKCRQEGSNEPLSQQELMAADPQARIYTGKDGIYMITGVNLPVIARDMESAFYAAYRLLPLLERSADTDLTLRSVVAEGDEREGTLEHIYVFQEVKAGKTVMGSTLRLVTNEEGRVKAVLNSLFAGDPSKQVVSAEAPDLPEAELIDAETAEKKVQQYLKDTGIVSTLLPDFTSQIIVLPEETEDGESVMETDENVPEELHWVVYSTSVDGSYLAHYLSADGTYLFHQKVKKPGDEAGQSESGTAYFFEKLEAAQYTGDVTYLNGETKSITVPVMKDPETGMYYLGDLQRRIVFADFYDFTYHDNELNFVSSADNTGWTDSDLITFETFLKVWDFYAALGWKSGDGLGTPVLMLHDMKLENETPLDNAAFGAIYKGWVLFAYDNSGVNFQEALDVWAHEYTHAVTGTLQGYNLYQNDQGAINESMSDIMGNLCQILETGKSDLSWLLGEDTTMIIRSMIDPHKYAQPEYVWDIYYGTDTTKPNDINDRGGVHSNSSILSLLAVRLCEEYGMPVECARDFWLKLAAWLTPMTDLPAIADVLEWVVQTPETQNWSGAVQQLIDQGQFRRVDAPTVLEESRKMVLLELPDTPSMRDEHWVLMALQIGGLSDILDLVMEHFLSGDSSGETAGDTGDDFIEESLTMLLKQYMSWTNGEDQNIYIQIEDRPTLYVLLNMDPDTLEPVGVAYYMNGKWHDVGPEVMTLVDTLPEEKVADTEEEAAEAVAEAILSIVENVTSMFFDTEDAGEVITEGIITILPSNGLEQIELPESALE